VEEIDPQQLQDNQEQHEIIERIQGIRKNVEVRRRSIDELGIRDLRADTHALGNAAISVGDSLLAAGSKLPDAVVVAATTSGWDSCLQVAIWKDASTVNRSCLLDRLRLCYLLATQQRRVGMSSLGLTRDEPPVANLFSQSPTKKKGTRRGTACGWVAPTGLIEETTQDGGVEGKEGELEPAKQELPKQKKKKKKKRRPTAAAWATEEAAAAAAGLEDEKEEVQEADVEDAKARDQKVHADELLLLLLGTLVVKDGRTSNAVPLLKRLLLDLPEAEIGAEKTAEVQAQRVVRAEEQEEAFALSRALNRALLLQLGEKRCAVLKLDEEGEDMDTMYTATEWKTRSVVFAMTKLLLEAEAAAAAAATVATVTAAGTTAAEEPVDGYLLRLIDSSDSREQDAVVELLIASYAASGAKKEKTDKGIVCSALIDALSFELWSAANEPHQQHRWFHQHQTHLNFFAKKAPHVRAVLQVLEGALQKSREWEAAAIMAKTKAATDNGAGAGEAGAPTDLPAAQSKSKSQPWQVQKAIKAAARGASTELDDSGRIVNSKQKALLERALVSLFRLRSLSAFDQQLREVLKLLVQDVGPASPSSAAFEQCCTSLTRILQAVLRHRWPTWQPEQQMVALTTVAEMLLWAHDRALQLSVSKVLNRSKEAGKGEGESNTSSKRRRAKARKMRRSLAESVADQVLTATVPPLVCRLCECLAGRSKTGPPADTTSSTATSSTTTSSATHKGRGVGASTRQLMETAIGILGGPFVLRAIMQVRACTLVACRE
jgi:hypothetical protein